MWTRRLHRFLGLVLLLPLCGWAATGFVFFLKPGYDAAYRSLRVRAYPLEAAREAPAVPAGCLELRMIRTVLGDHVLCRTVSGAEQLDPGTLGPRPLPEESDLRRLLDDAISVDPPRYGTLASVTRNVRDRSVSARTTTGVELALDWPTLSLAQEGRDTRRIDLLYRIHYLQWTGQELLDRCVGFLGLLSLLLLAALGVRLAFGAR
jgi:hypothetical protein